MNIVINANTRHTFPLASESVQCAITSPPYWGKRDYGVKGQLGMERTPDEYCANLVAAFREVWRVLKDDGVIWVNLGDSYARNGGEAGGGNRELLHMEGKQKRMMKIPGGCGLKEKDLVGIPWMVAFALRADGWYLRSEVIWHKPNPMPESVTDRPTVAHEQIFLLSKSARYFYDADAIKEPFADSTANDPRLTQEGYDVGRPERGFPGQASRGSGLIIPKAYRGSSFTNGKSTHGRENIGQGQRQEIYLRNKRTVWTVPPAQFKGAHFATFPPKLVEPMILAGSAPGDLVLDPFAGTATVGRVAIQHRRRFVGLELNPAYIALAQDRTSNVEVRMF